MFKRFFGYKTLLVLVIFAGSWGLTLWSWRDNHRLPTAEEIATSFVLLPTALCLGYWALYRSVEWLKRPRELLSSTDAEGAAHVGEAKQLVQLQILDYGVYLPAGDEPAMIVESLKARDRPGFHPTLKSADGFPLRAAWIDSLDVGDFIREEQGKDLPVEVKRALLLASEVLEPLLMRLLGRRGCGDEPRSQLPVYFLVPARWEPEIQVAAQQWLASRLSRFSILGLDHQVFVQGATKTREVLSFVEQLRNSGALPSEQPQQVVIASDSFDPDDAQTASTRKTPGEGACALLLARVDPTVQGPAVAVVHPFSHERREHSADQPGKVQSALLARLIGQTIPDPNSISRVMGDAEQGTSRQAETLAALHATLPELDPFGDCLHLPMCCADMGAVTSLAALALAAAHTLETQKETLLVSVQDPFWRAVCRIQPPEPASQTPFQDLA